MKRGSASAADARRPVRPHNTAPRPGTTSQRPRFTSPKRCVFTRPRRRTAPNQTLTAPVAACSVPHRIQLKGTSRRIGMRRIPQRARRARAPAENRAADVDRALAFTPADDGAAATVGAADHRARQPHHEMHPKAGRRGPDDLALECMQVRDPPFGGVLAGTRGDETVGLPFLAQEAEHGGQRRQADLAVAQARRVQPRLVELQPRRQQVRDRWCMLATSSRPAGSTCFNGWLDC